MLSDLDEEYRQHIVPSRPLWRARLWYWRQAVGSIPAAILLRRRWVAEFAGDLRHGLRLLRRQPASAVAAIVTMALGMAGTTAVFTVTNGILLRPLPYAEPDRLTSVNELDLSRDSTSGNVSYPDFLDYRAENTSFEHMAGHNGGTRILSGLGPPDRVAIGEVTDGFFAMLGARLALGRDFESSDLVATAPLVAILTDGTWRRRFGSDPAIVGRVIVLSGESVTVVGVLPGTFEFPLRGRTEIWVPVRLSQAQIERRYYHWLDLMGRLRPGVTPEQAAADLDAVAQRFAARDPRWHQKTRVTVTPLPERLVGSIRPTLVVLLAAAVVLLAAACASIGGLLVARGVRRAREMAVRAAIGGSASRLIRQLLAEGVAIAIPGGVLGVLLGLVMVRAFVASLPAGQRVSLPHIETLGLDPVLVAVTAGVSILAAISFSLVPAWEASRTAVAPSLRVRDTTPERSRLVTAFVAIQLALALVLLTGAGLLAKSMSRLMSTSPGFSRGDDLLTMRVTVTGARAQSRPALMGFHSDTLAAIAALPGVTGAATINQLPLTGRGNNGMFKIAGSGPAQSIEHRTLIRTISAGYFGVMGIPVKSGRTFESTDVAGTPRIVVVNQVLADSVFGGTALGQEISFPFFEGEPLWRIVGVVGNEQFDELGRAMPPVVYFPYTQTPDGSFSIVARATTPESLSQPIRTRLAEIDTGIPVYALTTMDRIVSESDPVYRRRAVLILIAGFAITALVLAAVGLYALVAQTVSQRTREIGLRVALGARRDQVLGTIVRRGVRPLVAGLAIGLPASALLAPSLGNLLFGISPTDPLTLAAVAAALSAVGLAACLIPAGRATRVDPATALRAE
jgi:putative ABC transport system permease protein